MKRFISALCALAIRSLGWFFEQRTGYSFKDGSRLVVRRLTWLQRRKLRKQLRKRGYAMGRAVDARLAPEFHNGVLTGYSFVANAQLDPVSYALMQDAWNQGMPMLLDGGVELRHIPLERMSGLPEQPQADFCPGSDGNLSEAGGEASYAD